MTIKREGLGIHLMEYLRAVILKTIVRFYVQKSMYLLNIILTDL